MDHVPVGSILLLLVADLLLVCGFSAYFGSAFAREAGSSRLAGLVSGLFVPVVAPVAWTLVALIRQRNELGVRRPAADDTARWVPVGLLIVAAVLLLAATPLAWASISGEYDGYALATDSSPADSGVGAVATLGSALVLALGAAVVATTTARRRVAFLAGIVAGCWVLVGVDSLIVLRALNRVANDVAGASGERATVSAGPAGALFCCLAAGIIGVTASVLLARGRAERPESEPASVSVPGSPLAAVQAPGQWGGVDAWGTPSPTATEWGSSPGSGATPDRGGNQW